ncbi:DEKNAAC104229 [Brettanomyces naardenensis]|uniref:DEKNAAC104229 n=1 Tax=Brettanomyces naardenensis TaxID=13370 RepID=A0A448YQF1_BRENA|nr:DEKNAAC104229 [Brettanomyces naardenensis]
MIPSTRLCDLPEFPFFDVRVSGLLLGVSQDRDHDNYPYVLHMVDFSKRNYPLGGFSGKLATSNEFMSFIASKGRIRGRKLSHWHEYLFDVVCFPREFKMLRNLWHKSTGESLKRFVCQYRKEWAEGGDYESDNSEDSNGASDGYNVYSYGHEGRSERPVYEETSNPIDYFLDTKGWFVSLCVKASAFNGAYQLKIDVTSYRGGGVYVYDVGKRQLEEDAFTMDAVLHDIVEDWRGFFGERYFQENFPFRGQIGGDSRKRMRVEAVQPAMEAKRQPMVVEKWTRPRKEARIEKRRASPDVKAWSASPYNSQRSNHTMRAMQSSPGYRKTDSDDDDGGVTQVRLPSDSISPLFSKIKDMNRLPIAKTNGQPSYYVKVKLVRVSSGGTKHMYTTPGGNIVNCRSIELEVTDGDGEGLQILVAGTDLLRFLGIQPVLTFSNIQQVVEYMEPRVKDRLRQMIFKQQEYCMLVKRSTVGISCNGEGICIPVWRWEYTDKGND